MDRQRVIEKVAKCFALANSKGAATNEAETALRQARWLMEQYNLQEQDVQACLANETIIPTGTKKAPPIWLHSLARTCATAFSCEYLACPAFGGGYAFKFVGIGVSAELATYAYAALHQQLLVARRKHVQEQTRCKLSTKRRRGQVFAEAWIDAVYKTVRAFAGEQLPEAEQAITAYLAVHHPHLSVTEAESTPARGYDSRSADKGWEQGTRARLHHGVKSSGYGQLLGGGK